MCEYFLLFFGSKLSRLEVCADDRKGSFGQRGLQRIMFEIKKTFLYRIILFPDNTFGCFFLFYFSRIFSLNPRAKKESLFHPTSYVTIYQEYRQYKGILNYVGLKFISSLIFLVLVRLMIELFQFTIIKRYEKKGVTNYLCISSSQVTSVRCLVNV